MSKNFKQLIFIVTYIAYTSIYIARVNLSVSGPSLIEQNILNTTQIGILGSVFSTVYAIGRLLNGGLSDRFPPYIMLTTGLVFAGISNVLIGFFPPFIAIFILWMSNAYAQSMLWSSVLCIVSGLYDEETAKRKTPVMVTSVAMGNILGIIINTFLITRLSAKFAFIIPGILTSVLGFVVLITTFKIKAPEKKEKVHTPFFALLKNKEILKMCAPAIMHGAIKDNITLWMTVYIVDTFAVNLEKSSLYILLIPSVAFAGRILYPFIFKLCKNNENTVSIYSFALCLIASVVLLFNNIGALTAVIMLSLIYCAVSVINTSILSIFPIYFVKSGNVASVGGIMDFATYFGAGIFSLIYGILIKKFGYTPMFISFILLSVLSILFLIPKRKISQNQN